MTFSTNGNISNASLDGLEARFVNIQAKVTENIALNLGLQRLILILNFFTQLGLTRVKTGKEASHTS